MATACSQVVGGWPDCCHFHLVGVCSRSHARCVSVNGAIVHVDNLKKTYSPWSLKRRKRVDALQGVSLEARSGDVFGLLGPNGAGKTTLIKILLGVVKPSSGSASLFGETVGSAAARQRVGYLPESLRIDRHHTARTALRFYGQLSRMSPPAKSQREVMNFLN